MNNIIIENIDKIKEYCKAYKVKELYAIGSVVSGKFSENSDIDLLVKFDNISIEEYTDNYFALHKMFRKIFNRKVDLITENSLSNPFFIKSIEKNKKLLYAG
jgi:predicted nucleotidyltransferase